MRHFKNETASKSIKPGGTQEVVIDVKSVSKSFKEVQAVKQLDLKIRRGEFVALLGPNGAGKTTLVEMIEGIQFPDTGEIRLFGKSWNEGASFIRQRMGLALQETRFFDKLTVEETLNLFAQFYRIDRGRTEDLLDLVDLQEKKKTYTVHLSGGQRQRLALGVSLVNDPELLLLDEPTTGLDPNARRSIWEILESLKSKGTTMILTTHYMEEAERLCERIIFMDQGIFLGQGSLEELLAAQGSGELIEFNLEQSLPGEAFSGIRGFLDFSWNEEAMRGKLNVENTTTALPDLLKIVENQGLLLHELQCRRQTLDDLFITLTGRHLDD